MKILIISAPSRNGAGIVSFNLKTQLESLGHDVYILSKFKDSDPKVIYVKRNLLEVLITKIKNKINNFLVKKDKRYHFFDYSERKRKRILKKIIQLMPDQLDLIIISFYQNFLNFNSFEYIYDRFKIPILFWMMDMAVFTGGCHYSWNCQRYKKYCGRCPALYSKRVNDISNDNLLYKLEVIKKIKPISIAISSYQRKQAKESTLFSNVPIYLMYHYLDLKQYKPTSKNEVRKKLGLKNTKILLFIASNIEEERKGFSHFIKALEIIDNNIRTKKKITIIIIGKYRNKIIEKFRNIELNYLGNINDRNLIIEYYQAASFTIIPTLMDSGPLTVMESLACGTPVIAYKIGVAEDLVRDGYNGYVATRGNFVNLADKIIAALELNSYRNLSENSVKIAQKYFSQVAQLKVLNMIINRVMKYG